MRMHQGIEFTMTPGRGDEGYFQVKLAENIIKLGFSPVFTVICSYFFNSNKEAFGAQVWA